MVVSVILPAAGRGERFAGEGAGKSKLEMDLGGRAVLIRAVELFISRPEVRQVLVAADPDKLDEFDFKWADKLGILGVKIVRGGRAERWETVLNALGEVDEQTTHVAVHDAARPLTDAATIDRVFKAAAHHDAVVPAVPVSATVKRVEAQGQALAEEADPLDAVLGSAGKESVEVHRIVETVPRGDLWLAQTPQVFKRQVLVRANQQIIDGKISAEHITDDAGLVEALGEVVVTVEGDPLNVKITTPNDLDFARAVLKMRGGGAEDLGPKRKFPTWAESED